MDIHTRIIDGRTHYSLDGRFGAPPPARLDTRAAVRETASRTAPAAPPTPVAPAPAQRTHADTALDADGELAALAMSLGEDDSPEARASRALVLGAVRAETDLVERARVTPEEVRAHHERLLASARSSREATLAADSQLDALAMRLGTTETSDADLAELALRGSL